MQTCVSVSLIFPSVSFTNNTLAECVAKLNRQAAELYKGDGKPPEIIVDTNPAEVVVSPVIIGFVKKDLLCE